MKLTLLLTVVCLQVSAAVYSQQITLSEKNASLVTVLDQISKQTGYTFFYNNKDLKKENNVTIDLKNATISQALDQLLQGRALTYEIDDKTVVLKPKTEPGFFEKIKQVIAAIDITGRIVDENNQPIPGATVQVKNGQNATITDVNGTFLLKNVQPGATILISVIGFEKQEQPAQTNMGTIKLRISTNPLDEVKVIGYGKQSERFSVGNVTPVKSDAIERQPVSSPMLTLQGLVPGVVVTQSNGLPGSNISVRIEGTNSLQNGSEPLYIVDDVPYPSFGLSTMATPLGTIGGVNPLNLINPSDIESISILKDASATAIYGSRGANGVVLITTKKGKIGNTKVNFSTQQGIGQVAHFIPYMNTQQYLQMRHEALKNDGISTIGSNLYDINGLWDTTRNANWQKELIGKNAQYHTSQADISGGSSDIQYFLSGTYHRETTVFPGNYSDSKATFHANLSNHASGRKFNFEFGINYLFDNNQLPKSDLTVYTSISPDAPALYNSDGSINWAPNSSGFTTFFNPIAQSLVTYQNKGYNLVSNLSLGYQFTKELGFKTNFGYNDLQQDEFSAVPINAIAPSSRSFATRGASYGNTRMNSWIIEPQMTYRRKISVGILDAIAGSSLQNSNNTYQVVNGTGYNSDAVLRNPGSASSVNSSGTFYQYKYAAIFGKISYNWKERIIAEGSFRRDGSSRFGANNLAHDFGAAGVGYIFTEENWLKNTLPLLSFGKVKLSYGTTGNDQIGDYNYLSLYYTAFAGIPYQNVSALTVGGLSNANLQWEETRKLSIGLDLGFFNDRLLLSGNFYRNRSSNLLIRESLPINSGFSSIAINFPAVIQNNGLELSLTSNIINKKGISWKSSVNFTLPENKLVSFDGLEKTTFANTLVVGKPFIGRTPVYHFAGVNPQTGVYQFQDRNGAITSNPSIKDRIDTVNLQPQFYGGWQNQIRIKGFQLDFLFRFTKQTSPNFYFGNVFNTLPGYFSGSGGNQPTGLLDRWTKPGDIAGHQRYNQNAAVFGQQTYAVASNAAYSDGSFLRLQNVSVSWLLPTSFLNKVKMTQASIFLQGQNLFTLTKIKNVFDPEALSYSALPPLRVMTLGLRAGF